LTPARSATPSHQRRTSHDQLASVDEQPRSQIRSINALSESFFASLKGELIDLQAWPTRAMARRAIVGYIAWFNGTRLHSTLGYKTPAEFEEQDKIRKVA
jgi:transposase InsO family protein